MSHSSTHSAPRVLGSHQAKCSLTEGASLESSEGPRPSCLNTLPGWGQAQGLAPLNLWEVSPFLWRKRKSPNKKHSPLLLVQFRKKRSSDLLPPAGRTASAWLFHTRDSQLGGRNRKHGNNWETSNKRTKNVKETKHLWAKPVQSWTNSPSREEYQGLEDLLVASHWWPRLPAGPGVVPAARR